MNPRLCAIALALSAVVAVSAQTATSPAPATMMTQDSVNVFRRFSVDRATVLAYYGDVIGLQTLSALNMPGGGQMSLFHIGTSQFKFTNAAAGRQDKSGPVLDVTGLRVFSFFYCSELEVAAKFTSHGYPAPDFHGTASRRSAMVTDPDGQWVELAIRPCDKPMSHFEIGATVSDLEKSRVFYRDFVGLEELPAFESQYGKTYRFALGRLHRTDALNNVPDLWTWNILNLWAAHPGAAANTYTAGIQYVVSDVESVDARAKANNVTIATPLGMFGAGLRTIWLGDPDGITNYFAQILSRTPR